MRPARMCCWQPREGVETLQIPASGGTDDAAVRHARQAADALRELGERAAAEDDAVCEENRARSPAGRAPAVEQ